MLISSAKHPLTQDEYPEALAASFGAACGLTALHLVLEKMDKVEQDHIKENLVSVWKKTWQSSFQETMKTYVGDLGKVRNVGKLPQPEEYQLLFNQALAAAERSARVSLQMGQTTEHKGN